MVRRCLYLSLSRTTSSGIPTSKHLVTNFSTWSGIRGKQWYRQWYKQWYRTRGTQFSRAQDLRNPTRMIYYNSQSRYSPVIQLQKMASWFRVSLFWVTNHVYISETVPPRKREECRGASEYRGCSRERGYWDAPAYNFRYTSLPRWILGAKPAD